MIDMIIKNRRVVILNKKTHYISIPFSYFRDGIFDKTKKYNIALKESGK